MYMYKGNSNRVFGWNFAIADPRSVETGFIWNFTAKCYQFWFNFQHSWLMQYFQVANMFVFPSF